VGQEEKYAVIFRSTMLNDFKQCPAKAAYKYELGITPIQSGQSNDLDFGALVHQAIEIYHNHSLDEAVSLIESSGMSETRRKNRSTAKALLKTYVSTNPVKMERLESDFTFKIGSHQWKGRFDGIGIYNGGRYVIEHKTTNPQYLILKPNDQFIAYWLGGFIYYQDIQGVLINSLDCDKLQVTRYPITFSKEEKEEWIEEMKAIAETYKRYKTKGIFPRNPASCFAYNRLCAYYPLCQEPEGTREMVMRKCYQHNSKMKNLEW